MGRFGLVAILLVTGLATVASADVTQIGPVHVFDTRAIDGGSYLNDHTFVQAADGSWHVFGIFHKEPADPDNEIQFVHAVNPVADPAQWKDGDFKLSPTSPIALTRDASIGETHLWAPHVVKDGSRYVMVYQSGGDDADRAQIRLATSTDLEIWTRASAQPLFTDICEARDPMLRKMGATWVLYYTRCADTTARSSGVGYRTSTDLVHWSDPRMALTLTQHPRVNSGFTESPFVFERGGAYYLSVTSYPVEYHATFLYRSDNPYSFPETPYARLYAHAPEWLVNAAGQLFMSSAGWGQGGLYLYKVLGL